MRSACAVLLCCIFVAIGAGPAFPADRDAGFACVRGKPEPLFPGKNPLIKSHSFTLQSQTEAVEEVVSATGDRIVVTNGGCEYFVNSFRFESAEIKAGDASPRHWAGEAVKALRKLKALQPSTVFDIAKAAETIERLIREQGKFALGREIPVAGDGTEFLQSRVVLKGGGSLPGTGGYVEFALIKGPL